VACFGLAACVSDTLRPVAAAESTAEVWQLSLSVAGGFAGFDQLFKTAGGSGVLLASDRRRDREVAVPLGATERQELARLVAAVATLPDSDLRSRQCRDCYQFELTIIAGGAGKPRRSIYDSTSLAGSPDAQLIELVITAGRAGLDQQDKK
jgi:hypothetical protein